jgi:hypothetical protein
MLLHRKGLPYRNKWCRNQQHEISNLYRISLATNNQRIYPLLPTPMTTASTILLHRPQTPGPHPPVTLPHQIRFYPHPSPFEIQDSHQSNPLHFLPFLTHQPPSSHLKTSTVSHHLNYGLKNHPSQDPQVLNLLHHSIPPLNSNGPNPLILRVQPHNSIPNTCSTSQTNPSTLFSLPRLRLSFPQLNSALQILPNPPKQPFHLVSHHLKSCAVRPHCQIDDQRSRASVLSWAIVP